MELALVGLSHKTAPIEVRERLAFNVGDLQEALRSLAGWEGVKGAMILSTCNRVEVLAESADDRAIKEFLCSYHRVPTETVNHHIYAFRDNEVVRHVFRVASSLDSMVVGEPQVLGQIKEAFRAAEAAGTVGTHIGPVMHYAFNVAKRVRTETTIAQSAVSVSFAAVELARKIFGDLNGKNVMIIGASKMGELAAKHLKSNGVSSVLVTNRTFDRAVEMAREFEGVAIPFDQLDEHIDRADIVISSTGAPHFVITRPQAEQIVRRRKNRPIFFIDIAVPRDIDPAVNNIDNLFLYDIDDLQRVVEDNLQERSNEASRAEAIIDNEVLAFCSRMELRRAVPTIMELQESFERIRRSEIERYRKQLEPLTEKQLQALDRITQSMMKKALHHPITELKDLLRQPDGAERLALIRKLFNVDKQ